MRKLPSYQLNISTVDTPNPLNNSTAPNLQIPPKDSTIPSKPPKPKPHPKPTLSHRPPNYYIQKRIKQRQLAYQKLSTSLG